MPVVVWRARGTFGRCLVGKIIIRWLSGDCGGILKHVCQDRGLYGRRPRSCNCLVVSVDWLRPTAVYIHAETSNATLPISIEQQ